MCVTSNLCIALTEQHINHMICSPVILPGTLCDWISGVYTQDAEKVSTR